MLRAMTGAAGATAPVGTADRAARRRTVLVVLACVWLVATPYALLGAAFSDWPPPGELPTVDQLQNARINASLAGTVAVVPAVAGLFLSIRWRNDVLTALFLVGVMFGVLSTGALFALTDSPVRPDGPGRDCTAPQATAEC